MDGYPATNTATFNGQLGNSIGPIKFESEPYHYDVSNNNQSYGYDGSGTYGQVPYQQTGYQYTPATQPQGTLQTNAQSQNYYSNQPSNQSSLPVTVNGDSKYVTPKKPMVKIYAFLVCWYSGITIIRSVCGPMKYFE